MNNYNPNDPTYLCHYGRKGMKWGKNIFEDDNPFSNLGKAIGNRISDVGNTISKTASNVGNTISKTASNVGKSASVAVNKVSRAIDPKTSTVSKQNFSRQFDDREKKDAEEREARNAYESIKNSLQNLDKNLDDLFKAAGGSIDYDAYLDYKDEMYRTSEYDTLQKMKKRWAARSYNNKEASSYKLMTKELADAYSNYQKKAQQVMQPYIAKAKKEKTKKNFNDVQSKAAKSGHSVYHSDNSGGHYYGVVYK